MTSRVVTLIVLACCAQVRAGQQRSQQPEATFRVQIDAVELDAFVTDASGNPVTDLTADDFEILENGTPQTITSFALVSIPIERLERPLLAESAIEPDVQANNTAEGRLYVIALDEVDPEHALRTRNFLRRFFDRYFAANDLGAVVFLGRARQSNAQDLTSNPRLLLKAVDSFSGGFRQDPVPASTTPGAAIPPPGPNLEREFAARQAMSSFRSVVEFMANVHGRKKALLLFSQGFSMDIFKVVDYRGGVLSIAEEDTHKAITAATRNNVAIYPIDPRGLTVDGGLAESETGISSDAFERLDASSAGLESRQSLRALATVTGGFALVNSNSFENAFSRIVRENSSYYVLGFTSSNDRRDGRYRRLQIRVKRPGLQVRGRDGYMAPLRNERPAAAPATPKNMSPALAEALRSPIAVKGLPMRVFAAPYKGSSREATVVMSVEVEASQLGLVEKNGTYIGTLEMSYLVSDTRNKIVGGRTHTVKLALKPETFDQARQSGLRLLTETQLPAGRFQIRVATGNAAGKSGSVVYDLEVPDFAKGSLVLSGVSVSSSLSSRVMTMHSASPLAKTLPGPLTTSREFDSGDTLTVYAEAYENSKDSAAHTLDLVAELRADGGRVVRKFSEDRSSKELQGSKGGYGFAAELPLTDVPAGVYVIHVEARSNGSGRPTASKDIQIRIR